MDHLEEERAGLFLAGDVRAAADGRQRTADETGDDFVDERETVALVGAEGDERDGFVRVEGDLAVLIHGGVRREHLAFALEYLDAAHGDDGGGPVDHDGEADGVGRGEAPRVRVGAEGRVLALEGDDFRERGGAIRISDITALGGFHHIATAPEVVEGVIDRDRAHTVLVGELDAAVDGVDGDGLAELLVGVPDFGGFEARGLLRDGGVGRAARDLGAGAEEFVEVQRLEGVVRADAVVRGHAGHLGGLSRLLGAEATLDVGGGDERLVGGAGDDVKDFAHG